MKEIDNSFYFRMCGNFWAADSTATAHASACSFSTPFKVGVHFDQDEVVASPVAADAITHAENNAVSSGSGVGYTGFYLNYWQNSC